MNYAELLRALYHAGYQRVERDDRLLDVFPAEDREKGIELWERWSPEEVRVLRVRLPFELKHLQLFIFLRAALEKLLQENMVKDLEEFPVAHEGSTVITNF